ncbi:MAG: DUF4249 domain-containing protein [Bacteroidia bacterium]|nr:DUF4249 domain-containing protein [Bacteroidia bacterium]
MKNLFIPILFLFTFFSCEKEIVIDVPSSEVQYVVEASINNRFPLLNYVFISTTIDYFKPDLSLNGVKDAEVYITPGNIIGLDTFYNEANRIRLFAVDTISKLIPALDSILGPFSGVYMNPFQLTGNASTAYKLDIFIGNGAKKITAKTYIPKVVPIDSFEYNIVPKTGSDSMGKAFVKFWFYDGPEKNNYRLAINISPDSILYGWGACKAYRTFDDEFTNNGNVPWTFISPFSQGDTLNLYLSHIGRKEFLFWQSFGKANNNGGPFATPGTVKSNIEGAIGSFTGYAVDYKQIIMK